VTMNEKMDVDHYINEMQCLTGSSCLNVMISGFVS